MSPMTQFAFSITLFLALTGKLCSQTSTTSLQGTVTDPSGGAIAGAPVILANTNPVVKVIVGGYDPSLASEAFEEIDADFIVRGEGEVTFRELLRAMEQGGDFSSYARWPASR
jgi:hypothetical protein